MNAEDMTIGGAVAAVLSLGTAQSLLENGTPTSSDAAADIQRDVMQRSGYTEVSDSRSITDDPFDVMSHEEIWARAGALSAGNVSDTSGSWRGLGSNAATDAAAFALALSNQIGSNWHGPAADAAGQGVAQYANSSVELMLAADSLANKVMQTHAGIASTRDTLPPPVPYAGGEKFLDAASWLGRTLLPGDIKSIQHVHEEAEEAARTVMKTQYAPAIRQAAAQIPVLPPAINPLGGSETFTVPGWGSGGGSGGTPYAAEPFLPAGGGGTTSGSGPQGSTPQDTATQASGWAPSETTPGSGPGGAANSGGGSGTNSPGTTSSSANGSPTGMVPGSAAGNSGAGSNGSRFSGGSGGGRGGLGSGGLGSGGLGGGGLGGGGLGSGGLGSGGSSGRGGSLSGGPLAGGPGGGGAGSAAGRTGAPGMGGMGGMAPAAGRGGGGGEDATHKTPGYLIDVVNGDELIGTLTLVAPPVLGE